MVLPLISKGCMNMKSSVGTYTTPHSGTLMLAQQHQQDHKNTSVKAVTLHMHKSAGALGPEVTGAGGLKGLQGSIQCCL